MNKFFACTLLICFSCFARSETLFDAICAKDGRSDRQYVLIDGDKYLSCGDWVITNGIWTGLTDMFDGVSYYFFVKEPGVQNGKMTVLLSGKNGSFIKKDAGIRSSIMSVNVDCQNSRYRHTQSLHYSGKMGTGNLLFTQRFGVNWINDPAVKGIFCTNK